MKRQAGPEIERLIQLLARLPGLGPRSARRAVLHLIKNREIVFIVNTTEGKQAIADSFSIRRQALQQRVTYSTTISGAKALLHSLDFRESGSVNSLQELHRELTE